MARGRPPRDWRKRVAILLARDRGKPNRIDTVSLYRQRPRPVCSCGHCHTCQVREIRHRELGGLPGCPLCAERALRQRDWARRADRSEYTRFPIPMLTMFGLIRRLAARGVVRRASIPPSQ